MDFDDLLDNLDKEASNTEQDEMPEAEKLASCLEEIAEVEKEAAEYKPVQKIAESIETLKILEEEGLI